MQKDYINILLWLVAGVIIGFGVYFLFMQPPVLMQPSALPSSQLPSNATVPETPPLAKINITIISAPDCEECGSAVLLLGQIQTVAEDYNMSIEQVTTFSADSAEAASLISKYEVERLPTMIIYGNPTESFTSVWESNVGTRETDGSLVFRAQILPYYDVENQTIIGLVEGIAIRASDCEQCMDPSLYFSLLESSDVGMLFSEKTVLEENDSQSQQLISQYGITKLPVLMLSDDAAVYQFFNDYILELGDMNDGWFVLRDVMPPYVDLEQNHSMRGFVDEIIITNSSCDECFAVSDLSQYLITTAGLRILNSSTYELNSTEAAALVAKYDIEKIPTVLYSPEASVYPDFDSAWLGQNNTIESDGWYVFRAHDLLGLEYQNVSG